MCLLQRTQNKPGAEWGRGRFGASCRAPGVWKDRLQVKRRARVRHIRTECDESRGLSDSGTSPLLPRIKSRMANTQALSTPTCSNSKVSFHGAMIYRICPSEVTSSPFHLIFLGSETLGTVRYRQGCSGKVQGGLCAHWNRWQRLQDRESCLLDVSPAGFLYESV